MNAHCLGGWCAVRDRCPFHKPGDASAAAGNLAERLCVKGRDGHLIGADFAKIHAAPIPVMPPAIEREEATS